MDPNKDAYAAAKEKRDAEADADVEAYEKANVWDAKRDAKTMAALMKVNQARCIETFDANGVSSNAQSLGNDDNLYEQMKKKEEEARDLETSHPPAPCNLIPALVL